MPYLYYGKEKFPTSIPNPTTWPTPNFICSTSASLCCGTFSGLYNCNIVKV